MLRKEVLKYILDIESVIGELEQIVALSVALSFNFYNRKGLVRPLNTQVIGAL